MHPAPCATYFAPAPRTLADCKKTRYRGRYRCDAAWIFARWVRVQQNQKCCTNVAANVAPKIQQNQSLTRQVQHCNTICRVLVCAHTRARIRVNIYISCCSVALVIYPIEKIGKSLQQKVQQMLQRFVAPLHLRPNPLKTLKKGEI